MTLVMCAAFAACDNTTEPTTPSQLVPVGNASVAGRAGEQATVQVKVTASNGKTLAGQTVTFTPGANAGSATPSTATTDANGVAQTVWKFGNAIGAQTLTATAGNGVSFNFVATVAAGRAASVAVSAGNAQSAAIGSTVAVRPAVVVKDAGGNPVSGVQVAFQPSAGTVTGGVATSDANGVAAVGSWQLGNTAGAQTLTATVLESGVSGNPVTFTATATAGAAAQITPQPLASVTATAGTALAANNLPTVVVRDASGNPVANVPVTFTFTSGGGTLTGATATTNASGVATVGGVTLGRTAGVNTITATAQGVGQVSFVLTGTAGTAARTVAQAGNNQQVRAGAALPIGPSVLVTDQFGNPVAGATVNFVVTSGGGSVLGGTQVTNAAGIATVGGFTLGVTPGTNTLAARVAGLPDVTFTETGLAGAASSITKIAGDSLTVLAFQQAATPFTVQVLDSAGFPVRNTTVTFAIAAGGVGTLTSTTATTDSLGRASVFYRATGSLGTSTVTATVGNLSPVTFTVTAAPNTPATVTAVQGNNQTATAGTTLAVTPIVQVRDAAGNPVPGITVLWNRVGPSIVGATESQTDSLGRASPGFWQLGGNAGEYVLSAVVSAPNVAGNPVRFSATAVTLPQNLTIAISAGDAQTAARGTVLPTQPAVVVRSNGVAVPNVTIQFLPSGDGTATPAFVQTDANGVARTSWKLATVAGQNTLTAFIVGAGASVTFNATGQ